MRERFEKRGWEEKLRNDQREFTHEFGEYGPSDFSYTYEGGENEGKVVVFHKGRKLGGLDVVLEEGSVRADGPRVVGPGLDYHPYYRGDGGAGGVYYRLVDILGVR